MPIQEPVAGAGPSEDRAVGRTDVLVELADAWEVGDLFARDAATGEMRGVSFTVRSGSGSGAPGVGPDPNLRYFALSPDGRDLLLGYYGHHGVWLVPVGPSARRGRAVPFPEEQFRPPVVATLAPDGSRVAAMTMAGDQSSDDDRVVVSVADTGGGPPRELWSARGAPTADAVITWSPDGRFLAVTWVDADDFDHTAVVDLDGITVVDLPNMGIIGSSRLAWTADHDLLLTHEFWNRDDGPEPLVLLDAATGQQRRTDWPEGVSVLGTLDGRLLLYSRDRRIWSTALDGSDPRTLLTFDPRFHAKFFDATPGALDATHHCRGR